MRKWERYDHERAATGGDLGDEVVGFANYSYYGVNGVDPLEGEGGEIVYYVEPCRTTNLPEVRDAFIVQCRVEYWRDKQHRENGGDIEYTEGSVLYYDTLEEAQKECDRLGALDESDAFL